MKGTIGIFDSGVGGVTVLRALRNFLPKGNYIYFGDTGRVPYGSKSPEIVTEYSVQIANFLRGKGIDMLVIGCNTASALASKVLEDHLDIPVFGVIKSTIRKAIASSKNGKIGVIGTKNTIESEAHRNSILSINPNLEVYTNASPMIVPYIEEDELDSVALDSELERYLHPLLKKNIDTLILGCTHYPIIKDRIQNIVGSEVTLIDSGVAIADDVFGFFSGGKKESLGQEGLTFYVTGGVKDFANKLERFGLPNTHIHQVGVYNLEQGLIIQKAEEYPTID